jgi:hypothetical protein
MARLLAGELGQNIVADNRDRRLRHRHGEYASESARSQTLRFSIIDTLLK